MTDPIDPLDELEALLDELDGVAAGGVMLLGQLDGYLASLIVSPKPIAQEDWLPLIWGGGALPLTDEAKAARLTQLILDRKSAIAGELLLGDMAYAPIYEVDPRFDEPLWDMWMDGFEQGVSLAPDDWTPLLDHKDEDLGAAATGLLMFIGLAHEPANNPELAEQAPDMIPYLVETLYRRQKGLDRVILAP